MSSHTTLNRRSRFSRNPRTSRLNRRDRAEQSKPSKRLLTGSARNGRPSPNGLLPKLRELVLPSAPVVHDFPSVTRQIAAPLQFTSRGVFAWFVLQPVNWEFLTRTERQALHEQVASAFGQLAAGCDQGRPIHIRRTTRPYSYAEWAARLHSQVDPLPAVPNTEHWAQYLVHAQRRLAHASLDQRMTAVGIWLCDPPSAEAVEDLTAGAEHPRREAAEILNQLSEVADVMSGDGLDAVFATGADLSFLMHRSQSMGVPAADSPTDQSWNADALGEFYDGRRWTGPRIAQHVKVVAVGADGNTHEKYVVPLSMGAMPATTWPENGKYGWLMGIDLLGDAAEGSVSGTLYRGDLMIKSATDAKHRADGIEDHYVHDHGEEPPPAARRAIDEARETLDQVSSGDHLTGPRFVGTIRFAVYGDTLTEAQEKKNRLKSLYRSQFLMPLHETLDPERVLREFVPAEPHVKKGWIKEFSMAYLAASMPNISSQAGTPSGFYVGAAALTGVPFLFDPFFGPEKLNKSGLIQVTGSPGAGKSALIGALAYAMALAGVYTVILDPSGPLAELARTPELAPFARVLDLSEAEPGTLSPYSLIPTPLRANYKTDRAWETAVSNAEGDRRLLLLDAFRMYLSPALLEVKGVNRVLQAAIRGMENDPRARAVDQTQWNPRWAMEHLRGAGDLAVEILEELEGAAGSNLGKLVIPRHSDPIGVSSFEDKHLVVLTMSGLTPPEEGLPRDQWPTDMLYSQAPMHLAAFYATRFVYSRPRKQRKAVVLDENHMLSQTASGKALLIRLGRDSRKFDTSVLVSSQAVQDFTTIDKVDSLMGALFSGYQPTLSAAQDACRQLGISDDYAVVFQRLRTGEFVVLDFGLPEDRKGRRSQGRIAKIRTDIFFHPTLARVLDTNPSVAREEWQPGLSAPDMIDPDLIGEPRAAVTV